jgi:hypothetical protein
MSKWHVVIEPQGQNPGSITKRASGLVDRAKAAITGTESSQGETVVENTGGMIIYLANGSARHEVTRVAFVRRDTACMNPGTEFKDQLRAEQEKAQEAARVMNDLLANAGVMQ